MKKFYLCIICIFALGLVNKPKFHWPWPVKGIEIEGIGEFKPNKPIIEKGVNDDDGTEPTTQSIRK